MPMYTLYPCKPDGSAATFEALQLRDDAGAAVCAEALIRLHPECAYVNVWQGDRKVLKMDRTKPPNLDLGPFETRPAFRTARRAPSGERGPRGQPGRR